MLNDFTQLIYAFFSALSQFLSTPPVLYIMGFLLITITIGIYLSIIRGGR